MQRAFEFLIAFFEKEQQDFSIYDQNDQAKVAQQDLRKIVQNTSISPFNGVGKIISKLYNAESQQYNSQTGNCAIISKDQIITSAHNIYFKKSKQIANQIYFYPQQHLNQGNYSKGIKVIGFYVDEGFFDLSNKSRSMKDYVILKLEANDIIKQDQILKINSKYTTEDIQKHPLLISGYSEIQVLKNKQLFETLQCSYEKDGFLFYKHTTNEGYSGCPVFLKISENDYQLIGIHKGSKDKMNFAISMKTLALNDIDLLDRNSIEKNLQHYTNCYRKVDYKNNFDGDLKFLKEQLKAMKDKQQRYLKQIQKLKKNSKNNIEELKQQKEDLNQQKIELIQANQNLKKENHKLKQQNEDLKTRIQKSDAMVEQLTAKLSSISKQANDNNSSNTSKLLNSANYLKLIFQPMELMKNMYTVVQTKDYYHLNHWAIPIKMSHFVKFDWGLLAKLTLHNCGVDDDAWEVFAKNAKVFQNLSVISLVKNKISKVDKSQLQQFRSLIIIFFFINIESYVNPLSLDSKKALEQFNAQNNPCKWAIANQNDYDKSFQWDRTHEKILYVYE